METSVEREGEQERCLFLCCGVQEAVQLLSPVGITHSLPRPSQPVINAKLPGSLARPSKIRQAVFVLP